MRVLAVGNRYPPEGGGGYERVFASTVAALTAAGHEPTVLTTESDLPSEGGVHRELRWWLEGSGFPRRSLRAALSVERHNAGVLRRHLADGVDVVCWWGMGGMSISLVEQVKRAGVPAVGVVGDDWMSYGPRVDQWLRWARRAGPAAGLLEARTGIPARADVAGAAKWLFASRFLRERSPAAVDAEVVSPGVDASRFPPQPAEPWRWRLAYVGRVDPRKGISVAVDALRHLPPEATLVIDGPEEAGHGEELRRQAPSAGLADRVTFQHSATGDVPAVYAGADAVLFPVVWEEPWGLVPLEAMATGRPVVATGTGGSAEYLADGENALLVPPSDAAALAAAVRRLADDEALRERLRTGGRATAERFSQAAFEARVIATLEQAQRTSEPGAPSA